MNREDLTVEFRSENTRYRVIIKNLSDQWSWFTFHPSAFGCCGACTGESLSAKFPTTENKEDFLHLLTRHMGLRRIYMLATTTQMNMAKTNNHTALAVLLDAGAEEMGAARPNLVHGPNKLHMLHWHPKEHMKETSKYLNVNQNIKSDQFSNQVAYRPLRFAKANGEKIWTPPESQPSDSLAKALKPTPYRDAYGMFAKRPA